MAEQRSKMKAGDMKKTQQKPVRLDTNTGSRSQSNGIEFEGILNRMYDKIKLAIYKDHLVKSVPTGWEARLKTERP